MPRPTIIRNVYGLPSYKAFGPLGPKGNLEIITMTIEEYEAIRLIDQENLTQEQCGEKMGVARTTAQRIYNNARKKLALCIIEGKILEIQGGSYQIHGRGQGRRNQKGRKNQF